jgi:hypothetical protein
VEGVEVEQLCTFILSIIYIDTVAELADLDA